MKISRTNRVLTFGVVTAFAVACGAKNDETKSEDTSTTPVNNGSTGASSSNKVGSATNIADLKLAGALAINLPEAFQGAKAQGSSLALLAGKKSQEACMMGMTIAEEVRSVGEVGGFFCHLELEKDRLKFGKKYRILFPNGNEFARIYVDNSQASAGKMTIGFCSTHRQDDGSTNRSRQLILIDNLTDNGPKGSIVSEGAGTFESTEFSYGKSQQFDLTVAGVTSLIGKAMFSHTGNTHVREVSLELKKTGLSSLKLANKGTSPAGDFFDRGVAFVSSDKGSAIFQTKGSFEGQVFEFANRAHFSNAGNVLGSSDVGAELQPPMSALPAYLPSDFKPDAQTGWVGQDCPDYDEDVTLDPDSPSHKACEQGQGKDYECHSQTEYERSSEQVTIE